MTDVIEAAFIIAVFILLLHVFAQADENHHPPQDQALHDLFYSTWLIPNGGRQRVSSCCNKMDCAPVAAVRHRGEFWQAQRESDGRWLTIPPGKVESMQADPRESPDGRSHMCSQGENVFCFVLGSGQ